MSDRNAKRGDAFCGPTNDAAPQELKITRDFRAPRDRVWRAWTQPNAVVRWLGPRHCPAVEVSADVRAGGAWRACLAPGNDKEMLWQSGRYLVVTPPERLEFTFAWEGSNHEDGPGAQTHVTVHLEDLANGGTRMHFSQTELVSAQSVIGHFAGWNSTFERLADYLIDPD
jgi:uncharacterized protein YndB with AHSA1/START domain